MKEIKINITKGKLQSFSVELGEDKIDLSATIGLYTEYGKKISSYSINTRSYYDNQIELPTGTIPAIIKIAEEIELATIRHCREGQLSLTE